MHRLVYKVFRLLGAMLLTMLVYWIIMGSVGRTTMWRAINSGLQRQWSETTMQDGAIRSAVVDDCFNNCVEYHER